MNPRGPPNDPWNPALVSALANVSAGRLESKTKCSTSGDSLRSSAHRWYRNVLYPFLSARLLHKSLSTRVGLTLRGLCAALGMR